MRFSTMFQTRPLQARAAAPESPSSDARTHAGDAVPALVQQAQDVPDDLDQRVRQVGEWQQLGDW